MRMHAAEIHNFVKSFTTHDSSFKQVVHALCQYKQPTQTKHNKGNNKITEHRAIFQWERQNS